MSAGTPRWMHRAHTIILLLALGALAASRPLHAQVGTTTDILTGQVLDSAGAPVADAIVSATSLETEITRETRTDGNGRYTILFPDGGGQYRLTARAIGYAPRAGVVVRYADEDRLVWDARLTGQPVMLEGVEVRGEVTVAPVRIPDRPTPGSIEQVLTTDQLARLPLDADELSLLAVLVPGAVVLNATDSTGTSFSIAGQRADANAVTLDGMTYGGASVPEEGTRATRMVTSTYDVSRGRFSGGMIATTSRSGANSVQSSWRYGFRDDALAFGTEDTSAFTSAYTQHQLSGGLGGPIIRNKLTAYLSGQARLRRDPLATLTTATPTDLTRLGIATDSVNRFMDIVNALGGGSALTFGDNRANDSWSGMLRMDYLASQNHTVTFRGDWRQSEQDPTRISVRGLPESGGTASNSGGGLMASVASRFGPRVINEGRVYWSESRQSSDPFLFLPQGRVQVASTLQDSTVSLTSLSFGGSTGMPSWSRDRSLEASDEVSWLPGSARHRLKLGGFLRIDQSRSEQSPNQLGTYTYNSLADLEADAPASFSRSLAATQRRSDTWEAAVYVASVSQVARAFQLTYGVRLEGSWLGPDPAYNPALDAALGLRTDRLPSEIAVSPRVGATWMLGGGGMAPPSFILRGGFGLFRSPLPGALASRAQTSTGLTGSGTDILGIGAAVPTPYWAAFAADTAAIPEACAGPSTPINTGLPNVAVFGDDFASPKAWRASFGVERLLSAMLRLSVDAQYARGVSQYGFRDLNLNTKGGFALSSEDGRPVFVAPSRIVAATGAVSFLDSRIDPSFAQVLEMYSGLASDSKQLTIGLSGYTRRGISLRLGYTWSHVRDQLSTALRGGFGRGGFGSTAGNPNTPEWGRSDLERQHSIVATLGYPFGASLEITAIGRFSSGSPFTPMVASDINGDGSSNDRAFVFDPTDPTTAPDVALGMSQLLQNGSASARACLEEQLGTLAARNSCTGPWESSLEFQINYRPRYWGLGGRVQLSVTTQNFLRGVDELVHGASNAHGWGLRQNPDASLLFVEGFDQATQTFQYRVNELFGATGGAANAQRVPFQIGLQVRISLGPDRMRDAIDRLRGAGGRGGFSGGFGGMGAGMRGAGMRGGITPENFLERFRTLLINPPSIALELSDSLGLSPDQIEILTAMRDSLTVENDSLAASLQRQIEAQGGADPRALMSHIQPAMQSARANALAAIERMRAVLTDQQWEKMPAAIREYGRRGVGRRPG